MQAVFDFFEAKEAVEVIEASDVIMSDEVIEATEVVRTSYVLEINKLMVTGNPRTREKNPRKQAQGGTGLRF